MKTLRVTVQLCLLLCLLPSFAGLASASPLVLTGSSHFSALDGSAQDSDGLADGVLTVAGDLVLDGTIHCNDDPPLPPSAGACPIRISVTGDLILEPGSEIFAENRRSTGNGGDIRLEAGGDVTVRGTGGSLPGALVSTSRIPGTLGTAGSLTIEAGGAVDLQPGSVLAANSQRGSGGAIAVTGELVSVAGLVASGPSRNVLATGDEVLDGGGIAQAGGTIHLRALGSEDSALRIEADGIVISQGEGNGGRLVLLEACGIEVRGLVASLSRNHGPSQVALRSGKGILIDGRDLGSPAPAAGRFGRIRADGTQQGAAGYLVDLFAESDLQILGPDPAATGIFAVTSIPGEWPHRNAGGSILALSLSGTLTATGNAFETGRDIFGDKGGAVDLQARGDVTLDGATVLAVGGFTSPSNAALGGQIGVRSFQGAVNWTFGVGDVRPTGNGVATARRGTIEITACTTVDTTGSQFPVNGSTVPPFPVETEGVCTPAAPSLPDGEPPLPTCAPANQPPAPAGGPFSLAENSPNGTVVGTVLANDPDPGQSHTFSIVPGDGSDAFAIDSSTGQITVADSTALDFETTPSFTLTVQATDNGTPAQSGTGTVIVNLTDVNEQPTDLALSGTTVTENSPAGTLIGTLSTVDPDSPDSHTYTLVSGAGIFQIVGSELQVATPPNYEANQSFSIQVQTTDAGGLFREESFTITVIDLNEPPTPVLDTYTAFGNTQLVAGGLAGTHRAFSADPDQVDSNDTDPDTLNPAFRNLSVIAGSGMTSKGGSYSIDTDGRFTYQPPVGYVTTTANPADPTGPDTFSYSLTDGTNTTSGGTVQITVNHKIWYVHNDPGTAGDAGDSADPVDTLAEAETKSGAGDYIYVFEGDGTNGGMEAGITLKDGQKLLGERVDLVVGGTTLVDADGTKRPEISDSNDTVSVLANTANGNRTGIEIRGLQLSSTGGSAIDLTSADSANLEATIHDVVITGTGALQEGIDVNAGSTGTVTLAIHGNTLASLGTAIDVQRTAGTVYIKAFDTNAVSGDTTGSGINIAGAIFDAVPGGSFDPVNGGVTVIGAPGNGVGQAGMVLTNVQGGLSFLDLDIFADGGAGLRVSGTGSGMTFGVLPGVGIIEATGGPAVDIAQASIALPLASIKSTNSPSTGLELNSVTGSFSAEAGSNISNITSLSGTAFQVASSNAAISYAGTISTTQGKGVDLTGNSGSTIALTGTLALSTGASTAFNATGGGTVTATDTANTLTSTTGTALNVASTTIGAGGLKFRSISADGAASGIVLNNTGSSGNLSVLGTGTADSGGTIQNTTSHGVSLTSTLSPSFTRMRIQNTAGSGVKGTQVTNFTFTNGTIDNSAMAGGADESNIAFNTAVSGAESNVSGAVTITNNSLTNSFWHGVDIQNFNGTLSDLNISSNTLTSSTSTASSKGAAIRLQSFGSASTAAIVTKATISNNVISNFPSGAGILAQGGNSNVSGPSGTFGTPGSGTSVISITGNQIAGASAVNRLGTSAITGTCNGKGQCNFDISSNGSLANPLTNIAGTVIGCAGSGSTTSTFAVSNNVIVANNMVASNGIGGGTGTTFGTSDTPNMTWTITNNNVSATDGNGILAVARGAMGTLNLKIQNNTVAAPLSGVRQGIRVDAGNAASVDDRVCLNISGNTTAGSGGTAGIGLRKQGITSTTNDFAVNGMAATATPGVEQYVGNGGGLNPGTANGAGDGSVNGVLLISAASGFSSCSLP